MALVSFSLLSPLLVSLDSTIRTATLEPLSTATRRWVLKTLTQLSSEMQGWAQLLLSLDKGMPLVQAAVPAVAGFGENRAERGEVGRKLCPMRFHFLYPKCPTKQI